jgi:hypothetical protein
MPVFLFSSDTTAVCEMLYSLLSNKFNFFELVGGKNGEVRFKFDGWSGCKLLLEFLRRVDFGA